MQIVTHLKNLYLVARDCSKAFLVLLLISFIFPFTGSVSFSQPAPSIQWQNTIGGSDIDALRCVWQTSDKGYILGGSSRSGISGDKLENNTGLSGMFDFWLIKTDSLGNIQWQNTIGGTGDDELNDVRQTADGGFILGGFSDSPVSGDKTEASIGSYDYWIVKTDSAGNILWQNTIGGSSSDYLASVRQTADHGYILRGSSSSNISGDKTANNKGTSSSTDYWIVKTDSSGNVQWDKTIGGNNMDDGGTIEQTSDGGFIVGGSSNSGLSGDKNENNTDTTLATDDYWVVKTDSLGNIQWQNTIGGTKLDILKSLQQTTDGGYILGGYSKSNISGDKTENSRNNTDDYWMVKLDTSGAIQWQKTIGGNSVDDFSSVQQTATGGYILGGYSISNISGDKTENSRSNSYDYWIVNTDTAGNIQWQKTIGGDMAEYLGSVRQSSDLGYILGGWSTSNISGDKTENCIGSGQDYWIVKLAPDSLTATFVSELPDQKSWDIMISPNPASGQLSIYCGSLQIEKAEIFNLIGQGRTLNLVQDKSQSAIADISTLDAGVYFVRITTNNGAVTKKVVKEW